MFAWVTSDGAPSSAVLSLVTALSPLKLSSSFPLLSTLIAALRASRRFALLNRVAAAAVPPAAAQLASPPDAPYARDVVQVLVLGCRLPHVFHSAVPHLARHLDALEAGTRAAVAAGTPPPDGLLPTVALVQQCLAAFPGFDAMAAPLAKRVAPYPTPSFDDTLRALQAAAWTAPLPPPGPLSDASRPVAGAFPWPEGAFSSSHEDITFVVAGEVEGARVAGFLGSASSGYGHLTACAPPLQAALPGTTAAVATLAPPAWTLPPSAVGFSPDAVDALSRRQPWSALVAAATLEGHALSGDVAAFAPPVGTSVLLRMGRTRFFWEAVVEGVLPGAAVCRCVEDKKVYMKPWEEVYGFVGVEAVSGAWEAVAEESKAADGEATSASAASTAWLLRCVGPGGRVVVPNTKGDQFLLGTVTKFNTDHSRVHVRHDSGAERWVPFDDVRVVRPMVASGGGFAPVADLKHGVATPFPSPSTDWLVRGVVSRAGARAASPFQVRVMGGGQRFVGSATHGTHEFRWWGVRASPVPGADLTDALAGGTVAPPRFLTLDGTAGVGVGGARSIELGGFAPFTVEAWVCPDGSWAPPPLPDGQSPPVEGSTAPRHDDRVLFSKTDRGVQGEVEVCLTAAGCLAVRRFSPVVFTVPDTLFVGEGFTLLFEKCGAAPGKDDWIGLFPVGSSNRAAKNKWYRIASSNGVVEWERGKGPDKGGAYELRYMVGNGFSNMLAASDPVTVVALDGGEEEAVGGGAVPSTAANLLVAPAPLPTDAFSHVAATSDGATLSLYLNGHLVASTRLYAGVPMVDVSCMIGATRAGGRLACGFAGCIAHARVWGACHPQAVIAATMGRRMRGWEPNLRGCWPLHGFDDVAFDTSPYGHHGVLTGPQVEASEEPAWGSPPASPPPVLGGFTSRLAADAGVPVAFAGSAGLDGLRVALWDGEVVPPTAPLGSGGAAWMAAPVSVTSGLEVTAELLVLAPGAHATFVLRACPRANLSPLDGSPVPLAPAVGDMPVYAVVPPRTLAVQIARLSIDRGVYEVRVYARGAHGPAVCLGETRGAGPEPARVRATLRGGYLRVAIASVFMGQAEAPVATVPVSMASIWGQDPPAVWCGIVGGPDVVAEARLAATSPATPTPTPPTPTPTPPNPDKPFACDACDRSYATEVNLTRHTSKAHPPPPPPPPSAGVAVSSWKVTTDAAPSPHVYAPVSGLLAVVRFWLLQLEGSTKPNVHRPSWTAARPAWRARVSSASTVVDLCDALVEFAKGVLLSAFSAKWKEGVGEVWRTTLSTLRSGAHRRLVYGEETPPHPPALPFDVAADRRFADDCVGGAVADLCDSLAALEGGLVSSATLNAWKDLRHWFSHALDRVRRAKEDAATRAAAGELSLVVGRSLEACAAAVREAAGDKAAAAEALMGTPTQAPLPTSLPDGAPVRGTFDTAWGEATLMVLGPWRGRHARGQYSWKSSPSTCTGYVSNSGGGPWVFRGTFQQASNLNPGGVSFHFSDTGDAFKGRFYHGESGRGSWNGTRDTSAWSRAGVGYAGLRNLGNTCYQNSLLQALFMTDAFKAALLACPPHVLAAADVGHPAASTVLRSLQEMFGYLVASDRPHIDPTPFHKVLPREPWGDRQQQDSYQFMLYLWDTLDQVVSHAAPSQPWLRRLHTTLFGGTLSSATVCQACGHASERTDAFTELPLTFPTNFTPVVDLVVVSGDTEEVAPPPGYDRLHVNLNSGRLGAPFSYLCVKRAKTWDDPTPPITDVMVVALSEAQTKAGDATPVTPPGFTLLDGEANAGGSCRVFLAVSRVPHGSPVTALEVVASKTSDVAPPQGFTRIPNDLNRATEGDFVFLCMKKGGAIRDVRLVTAAALAPAGYACLSVDVGMAASSDGEPHAVQLAYTAGGNLPPITGVRVVPAADLAGLLAAADAAGDAIDAAAVEAATHGVVHAELAEPFGWHHVGDLPGGRSLVVKRGQGSPLVSISVFRAPEAVPRYGHSGVVDLVPGDTLGPAMGCAVGLPGGAPVDGLTGAVASVLGRWRMTTTDMDSIWFGAEPVEGEGGLPGGTVEDAVRVVGYVATAWIGLTDNDVVVSESEDGSEGGGAPLLRTSSLIKTGAVSALVYRPVGEHVKDVPGGEAVVPWIMEGDWETDSDAPRFPCRFNALAPPGWAPGSPGDRHLLGTFAADKEVSMWETAATGDPVCRGLLRKQVITQVVVLKADAKVPTDFVAIERTVCGGSAHMRAFSDPLRRGVADDGSEKMVNVRLAYCRGRKGKSVCGLAVARAPETSEAAAAREAVAGKMWSRQRQTLVAPGVPPGEDGRAPGMSLWVRGLPLPPGDLPSGDEAVDGGLPPVPDDVAGEWDFGVGFARPGQVLVGVCMVVDGDPTPAGFVDSGLVFAGAGDGAPLLRLCLHYAGQGGGSLPFEGVWETADGRRLEVLAETAFEGYVTHARYTEPNEDERSGEEGKPNIGTVRAVLWSPPGTASGWAINGFWKDACVEYDAGFPMHCKLSGDGASLEGSWTHGAMEGSWKGCKDAYCALAYTIDSSTLWCLGSPVFSPSVPDNSLKSLVQRFHTPEIVDYSCDACDAKATAIKRMDSGFPPHLLFIAKRFEMNWMTQQAIKIGASMPFPAMFHYPDTRPGGQAGGGQRYGLYAVVVHSGASLNRGHYYAFARPSSCPELHVEDSASHPWRRLDDRTVTPTTFGEFTAFLSGSETASAYMLFYRRLDWEPAPGGPPPTVASMTGFVANSVAADKGDMLEEFEDLTGSAFLDDMHAYYVDRVAGAEAAGLGRGEGVGGAPLEVSSVVGAAVDDEYGGMEAAGCEQCGKVWPVSLVCLCCAEAAEVVMPEVPRGEGKEGGGDGEGGGGGEGGGAAGGHAAAGAAGLGVPVSDVWVRVFL